MYQPREIRYKNQSNNHVEFDYDFNNPALCRINGIVCSYCCICHKYLGNEYDTDWHKLIKREYCPSCRDKVITEQNSNRKRKQRKMARQEKKELKQQSNLLKQENQLLKEMVVALRDDLDKLKRE